MGIRTDITEFNQAADELRQAKKMEAIGQLTGGVAYDFNYRKTAIHASSNEIQRNILSKAILGMQVLCDTNGSC